MALRDEDKRWVRDEVARSIAPFHPKGWKKLTLWAKEWAGVANLLAVFFGLLALCVTLGVFAATEHSAANKRFGDEQRFEQATNDKFASIGDTLKRVEEDQAREVLLRDPQASYQGITRAVSRLLNGHIDGLSRQEVLDAGGRLLRRTADAVSDPSAYQAVSSVLTYVSLLNGRLNLPTLGSGHFQQTTYTLPPGWAPQVVGEFGVETKPNLPFLGSIGSADSNVGNTTGPSFLILQGGEIMLDGAEVRRVVIRNAHVSYHGGPVKLQNVFFVDCVFDVAPSKNSQLLAKSLITENGRTDIALAATPKSPKDAKG